MHMATRILDNVLAALRLEYEIGHRRLDGRFDIKVYITIALRVSAFHAFQSVNIANRYASADLATA